MPRFFILIVFALAMPASAFGGPKEDAFRVVEQFKSAYDASDAPGVVKLFAPDALFMGTTAPKLATTTDEIEKYFKAATSTNLPKRVDIEDYSSLVLNDNAVLFTGLDTFSQTKDGQVIRVPAPFTFVITKGDQGWRITHFHSSARPTPP